MKTIEIDDTVLERFDCMISKYETDTGRTASYSAMLGTLLKEFKY